MNGDALPTSRAALTPQASPNPSPKPSPRPALGRLFAAETSGTSGVLAELASRSDAAMRVLFDHANAGLLLVDASGRIARANQALRTLLAEDVDLTAGAAAALIFTPEERAATWRKMQALMSNREPNCRLTARLRMADPSPERRADVVCRLLPEDDGAIGGLLLRITDITGQIRLEGDLARSQELEAVGRLVGGVAHDFNNLLTAILGSVDLVQEQKTNPSIRAEMIQIRRSAERGATLVRNLLALGRQQYLQAAPLDVNAALQTFAAQVRRALGRTIRLDLSLEHPGRWVRTDPDQLDQVLMNLALNARAAMPDGGTLTLRSGRATLYQPETRGQETIPPGRYVTISVQDTGVGIPPELLGRIFEPFFTTRRAQGGSGLGLATALGIIRQSHGFLTVDSEPGRGTTFCIYLPREATQPDVPDAPAAQPVPLHADVPPSARRVLLVEDEPTVLRVTARALSRNGWEVVEADSAETALALLDDDPDIGLTALVSDVVMPGQDGAALVEAVLARYPGLPCILVSGYAERLVAERSRQGTAFLSKPYSPRALLARLEELVPAPADAAADRATNPVATAAGE